MAQFDSAKKITFLARGVFPLLVFECSEFKKNKGNQFRSLLLYFKNSLKKEQIHIRDEVDLAKFIFCFAKIKNSFAKLATTDKTEQLAQLVQNYVNSSLLEVENEEEVIVTRREKKTID